MKKVILVYPKVAEIEFQEVMMPPYSLLFLSDSLLKVGMTPEIYDLRIQKPQDIFKSINEEEPVCVGVSVMTGPQIMHGLSITEKIKENYPYIPIIWGGVHPTLLPEQTLKNKNIDMVVRNEGEKTFSELVRELVKNPFDLPKIVKIPPEKREFITNLDEISPPWNLLPNIKKYIAKKDGFNTFCFITSRGCPHRCAFCYNHQYHRRKWRGWSEGKCKSEIEKILDFGVERILFYDDNFAADRSRLKALLPFFKEKKIKWNCEIRVDYLKPKLLSEMCDSGCDEIYMGAESGSQRMLNLIQKDITVEDIINSARLISDVELNANYSWIIGFPEETKKDRQMTIECVDKIRSIVPESLHFIKIYTPYPGAPLFEKAVKHGFVPPERLEEWGRFTREECVLGYVDNPWELKSITYCSYFALTSNKRASVKPLYTIPFKMLSMAAKLRWRFKFFGMPMEYVGIDYVKKLAPKHRSKTGGD